MGSSAINFKSFDIVAFASKDNVRATNQFKDADSRIGEMLGTLHDKRIGEFKNQIHTMIQSSLCTLPFI